MCRITGVMLLLLLAVFPVVAQYSLYPNLTNHAGCGVLFVHVGPIQKDDVHDLLKTDRFDVKLVKYSREFGQGREIMDNLSGLYVNATDFSRLWPKGQINSDYVDHLRGFLEKLPDGSDLYKKDLFICTYKNKGQEVVTYCHFQGPRLVAYAHPILPDPDEFRIDTIILNSELRYAVKQGLSVVWYGDEITMNIEERARAEGVNLYRRAPGISAKLPETLGALDKVLAPEQSAICNALPTTIRQLMEGGHPATPETLAAWKSYFTDIEDITKEFGSRLTTLDDLKKEMLEGTNDVVFVVAHLKGADLYVGTEKVTLEEIRSWGRRQTPTSGNRVAVLCICNSGNQQYTTGGFFWKTHADPLANILKENGYFDMVIAPDHVILRPETTEFMQKLLKTRSVREIQDIFAGWGFWVYAH